MALRVYNTLTRRKEAFQSIEPGKIGIYACGITVYDLCHIGHARSAIVFDVINKYLQYLGFEVTFIKNFTDVDDKIIDRAHAEGCDIKDISEKYIQAHNRDMDALGVARPTIAPRATENIEGMIRLITTLFEKGLAYDVDGDVYYAVEKFKDYGKLSGRNLEDMLAGARVDINENKRNPMDFALWKASKEGEPWWDSPWGKGRPGWHIECSVMSQRYLGETFDIHGGGEDLIFPHHENEIAQSEGATGKPLARYWLHNGFVRVNSEKMSKSLGNFSTIQDMLLGYHPEVLRLFVLQSHYRSPVDFSEESLRDARMGMTRFYATLKALKGSLARHGGTADEWKGSLTEEHRQVFEKIMTLPERFTEAMDDDFNTARAIGHLYDAVRILNSYMAERQNEPVPEETVYVLVRSREILLRIGAVLGLFLDDPDHYFDADRNREIRKRGLNIEEIESLIEARRLARVQKDWKKADEIRQALVEKKVSLKDTSDRTVWKIE